MQIHQTGRLHRGPFRPGAGTRALPSLHPTRSQEMSRDARLTGRRGLLPSVRLFLVVGYHCRMVVPAPPLLWATPRICPFYVSEIALSPRFSGNKTGDGLQFMWGMVSLAGVCDLRMRMLDPRRLGGLSVLLAGYTAGQCGHQRRYLSEPGGGK